MTILNPITDQYQPSMAGTVAELSEKLLDELMLSGDSVSIEDTEKSIIDHVVLYAGWETLHIQKTSSVPVEIDRNISLEVGEWSILEPIVRSHLEYLHAKRTDGSNAISGERTGKDPITAYQDYITAKNELGKLAFCEEVFSV